MILYRLTKTRCQMSAWPEPGAKEAGVRRNSVGTEMVYLSGAASLMMLRTLGHLNTSQLNDDFTLTGSTEVLDSQVMAFDIDMFHLGRMRRCFSRRKTMRPAFPERQGGTAWQDGL